MVQDNKTHFTPCTPQTDVSSFCRPNFVVVSSGSLWSYKCVVYSSVESAFWFCNNMETMRDRIKLVLITNWNWKSNMGFRLVPKSVTLNDLMAVILLHSAEFHSHRANFGSGWIQKKCEKCSPENLVFRIIWLTATFAEVSENEFAIQRIRYREASPVKSDNLTKTVRYPANSARQDAR